jgi:hypothetical protein
LEVDLDNARYGERQSDEDHEEVHEPESLSAQCLAADLHSPDLGHREIHHRDVQHGIGAVEGEVSVGSRRLGSMRPLIYLGKGMVKPQTPAPKKCMIAQPTAQITVHFLVFIIVMKIL